MIRRTIFLVAVLIFLLAQPIAAQSSPVPVMELNGWPDGLQTIDHGWLAKKGDDPAFANPALDDSGWQSLAGGQSFSVGTGYRWYRLHLRVPKQHSALGLLLVAPDNAFEVFVNGQRIPGFRIRSQLLMRNPKYQAVALPDAPRDLLIAIRLFQPPYVQMTTAGQDRYTQASIGPLSVVQLRRDTARSQNSTAAASSIAINLVLCLCGIAVLGLFWAERAHIEYFWLGAYLLLQGLEDLAYSLDRFGFAPFCSNALFGDPASYLVVLLQVEFTFAFIERRMGWFWRTYEVLLVAASLAAACIDWFGLGGKWYLVFGSLLAIPALIGLPLALIIWFHRGNREAGWLIFPSLLPALAIVTFNLELLWVVFLHSRRMDVLARIDQFYIGPYLVRFQAAVELIFLLAILVVIFFRHTRVARAQIRAAAELEAAHEIQRKLVPAELPQLENYRFAAAYAPAAEVGGDFYQVLPQPDGSTLIALGDVSGKGVKAAMTGALVIGALRTLATEGGDLRVLIEKLNRQVVASGQDGFVTLVCMRLQPDGALSVVNAGHLHPYWNGREVPVESGFPLGITSHATYEEQQIQLAPGDSLILLSDGVVEARNATGELFGFDRTQAISHSSPEEIARAAQLFGQEDDITVVRLSFSSAVPDRGNSFADAAIAS